MIATKMITANDLRANAGLAFDDVTDGHPRLVFLSKKPIGYICSIRDGQNITIRQAVKDAKEGKYNFADGGDENG